MLTLSSPANSWLKHEIVPPSSTLPALFSCHALADGRELFHESPVTRGKCSRNRGRFDVTCGRSHSTCRCLHCLQQTMSVHLIL
jgi:hypothetical protein